MSAVMEREELEARLLELLESEGTSASAWIEALETGRRAGFAEATGVWATMAQEALAKAKDVEGGTDLLKWRAENTPIESMTGKDWVKVADTVAGSDPALLAFIQEAGFGGYLATRECVRRFRLLQHLQPGVLCLHPTWGFGVVQRSDILYKKVEINFAGRPGHGLAMKAAVESLELLPEEHLLARWHRDRDGMRKMVEESPADVVRMALDSFGPTPVGVLQKKLLQYGIVADADWKRFWADARKVLKADPMVVIPAKRTEPLLRLDRAMGYDEAWFDKLSNERDLKTVLERVQELAGSSTKAEELSESQKDVLGNRLSFVVRGAGTEQPGFVLLAVMLATKLGLPMDACDWAETARRFLNVQSMVGLMHDLPARHWKDALDFLWELDAEDSREVLLGALPLFHYAPLQRVMEILLRENAGDACREIFAQGCARHQLPQEMLLWAMRQPEWRTKWELPPESVLSVLVVDELEQDYMGERLKTQKQLREQFEEPDWLKATFDGLTPGRQNDFFRRIVGSTAWRGLDRQVVQAKVLKLFPGLQSVITGEEEQQPAAVSSGAVTSHRSYRERQEKLDHLIQVEIPENSKEIAVARSYGDLSENFEYKAAKDMQGVLMARRAELEAEMARVRPTDFADASAETAGVGTSVELEHADGRTESYHILGEWDQQPELRIISSNTRLAKALTGKKAGERVMVPTEDGGESECLLKSVSGLPADIREWVK